MQDEIEILTLPAAAEFMNLSEAFVSKAIGEDPEQGTPIAAEVTRLMVECMGTFKAHFGQDCYIPSRILRIETRCPIEGLPCYCRRRSRGHPSGETRCRGGSRTCEERFRLRLPTGSRNTSSPLALVAPMFRCRRKCALMVSRAMCCNFSSGCGFLLRAVLPAWANLLPLP